MISLGLKEKKMSYVIHITDEQKRLMRTLAENINSYIKIVTEFKNEAERTQDWAEYHKCVGKIEAYKSVIRGFDV